MSAGTIDHVAVGQLATLVELLSDIAKMLDRLASRDGVTYRIPADTTTVTFLEANRFRHLATVYNDSTATLYLKLGAGVSSDDWTISLGAGDYYECPAGYTGPISGVWTSATGRARVTELA